MAALLFRAPKDHINIGVLPTVIAGISLILGPGTSMGNSYVYVVFWAPTFWILLGVWGRTARSSRCRREAGGAETPGAEGGPLGSAPLVQELQF